MKKNACLELFFTLIVLKSNPSKVRAFIVAYKKQINTQLYHKLQLKHAVVF
jgi:hypothetical protein